MPHPFKKIRTKLVLLNLLVFGVIQVAVSVLIMGLRVRDLSQTFDEQLVRIGIRDGRAALPQLSFSRIVPGESTDPQSSIISEYYFEIRQNDGTLLTRSTNLGNHEISISPNTLAAAKSRPVFETITGAAAEAISRNSNSIRVLTFCDDAATRFVQIAASMNVIDERIESLQEIIFLATPIGLLAVGLASYLMARRALAPIGRVARQAQELTAQRLDRRIEVPKGRDELTEMVVVINQMLDRLQDAFNAQERFIANAAHELKTPLTLLLGKAQVLAQRNREEAEYRQYMETVQTETRRLAKIVESLLVLARVDAGLPLPGMEPISINEVVMDAVHECNAYGEARNVRITPHLAITENQDGPMIEGDAELLSVMFSNVIRNAIRFSPPNEVVDVRVAQSDSTISIDVSDHGPGITQLQLDRLFERFYQADQGTGHSQGSGLGLTIAQGVARLHCGSISICSESAKGGCRVQFKFACTNPVDERSFQPRRSS